MQKLFYNTIFPQYTHLHLSCKINIRLAEKSKNQSYISATKNLLTREGGWTQVHSSEYRHYNVLSGQVIRIALPSKWVTEHRCFCTVPFLNLHKILRAGHAGLHCGSLKRLSSREYSTPFERESKVHEGYIGRSPGRADLGLPSNCKATLSLFFLFSRHSIFTTRSNSLVPSLAYLCTQKWQHKVALFTGTQPTSYNLSLWSLPFHYLSIIL